MTIAALPALPAGAWLSLAAAATLAAIAATGAACLPRRPRLARWLAHRRRAGLRPPSRRGHARGRGRGAAARWWPARLPPPPWSEALRTVWLARGPGARLQRRMRQAGVAIHPGAAAGAVAGGAAAVAAVLVAVAALGWAVFPLPVAVAAVAAVPGLAAAELVQRGRRRRRTVLGQLPILADLMVLEQTGGGIGFRRALEEVVTQVGGLASDSLLDCLTQSALTGGAHLDERIDALATELSLSPLASLATVARLQRTEGAAVGPVLRQLAATLRDQQRDALLAAGKRQVVQMLLPTGLCILLPFIALVLYPALARLLGALA